MDYKKKYMEALERAKKMLASKRSVIVEKQALETIFPELAEVEDKIMKRCIGDVVRKYGSEFTSGTVTKEKMLAWLEKQGEKTNPYSGISFEYNGHTWGMCARDNGVDILFDCELINHLEKPCEQKFTDKVESKFKVGDWLKYRSAEPFLVEEITEQGYINGNSCLPFEWENEIHLWSIQDAKDGDVLACNEEILLFKSYSVQGRISLYCWYNGQTKNFHSKEVDNTSLTTRNKIFPATKEQRDILFAKMKEAGYEWNADRKELKRIEGQDIPKDYNSIVPYIGKNIEMKPSWTEEDTSKIRRICKYLDEAKEYFGDVSEIRECIEWVNSIKDRIGFGLICTIKESTNEHEPTDNESKFRVGDWIVVENTVGQILDVLRDYYVGIDTNGMTFTLSTTEGNSDAHLWTIKDAKDGDVLVDVYGNIGIFEKRYGVNWHTYCYLGFEGCFISKSGSHGSICYPATKKQQDYLFQKMGESGYIWDDHAKMLICSTNMESK